MTTLLHFGIYAASYFDIQNVEDLTIQLFSYDAVSQDNTVVMSRAIAEPGRAGLSHPVVDLVKVGMFRHGGENCFMGYSERLHMLAVCVPKEVIFDAKRS